MMAKRGEKKTELYLDFIDSNRQRKSAQKTGDLNNNQKRSEKQKICFQWIDRQLQRKLIIKLKEKIRYTGISQQIQIYNT